VQPPQRPAPEVRAWDPRTQTTAQPREPRAEHTVTRPTSRPRARRVAPVVLLLAGAVLGYATSELLHAQRERAAQQALDLRVEFSPESGGTRQQVRGDGLGLSRVLTLRNAGPRQVQLRGAELVGGPMTAPVFSAGLPAGERVDLELQTHLDCVVGAAPVVAPPGSALRVRALTATGERVVDLPVPPAVLQDLQDRAAQLCGVVPVSSALSAGSESERVRGGRLVVGLSLTSATTSRVRLAGVDADLSGLAVAVRVGARPARLPLTLPSVTSARFRVPGASGEPLRVEVEVSASDCVALRRAVVALPSDEGPPPSGESLSLLRLSYDVEGAPEQGTLRVPDRGGVRELLASSCG